MRYVMDLVLTPETVWKIFLAGYVSASVISLAVFYILTKVYVRE